LVGVGAGGKSFRYLIYTLKQIDLATKFLDNFFALAKLPGKVC